MTTRDTRPQKVAAGYVLGILLIAIVVAMWLRGVARFAVPVLLIALGAWFVARVVRKIREPLP